MYLEISDRQTGKTQRLINQIYRDTTIYDRQILMCTDLIANRLLQSIICKQLAPDKFIICTSHNNFIKWCIDDTTRLYVDEFMYCDYFCNNYIAISNAYPKLIENGYFVSSFNEDYNLRVLEELKLINDKLSGSILSMHKLRTVITKI